MKFDVEMASNSFNKSNLKFELTGDLEKYLEVKDISLDTSDYKKATLVLGYKSTIDEKDIPVANTMVEYYLRNEQKMQIAIDGLKSWATGKLEEVTGGKVESNKITVSLQYEDKVKPMLLSGIAYRVNKNFNVTDPNTTPPTVSQIPAELELTFSEAIDLDNFKADPSVFATLSPSLGSSISVKNVASAQNEDSQPINNKVVLTLEGTFKDLENLTININEPATGASTDKYLTDIANNTILVDPTNSRTYKALYIYRQMPMKVSFANLDLDNMLAPGKNSSGQIIQQSKGVVIGLTGGYKYSGMRVHYLVANALVTDVSAEQIIYADGSISDLYGSREISDLNERIVFLAPIYNNQVFNDDAQYIYVVVTDMYGNISNVVREQIIYFKP